MAKKRIIHYWNSDKDGYACNTCRDIVFVATVTSDRVTCPRCKSKLKNDNKTLLAYLWESTTWHFSCPHCKAENESDRYLAGDIVSCLSCGKDCMLTSDPDSDGQEDEEWEE